MVGSLHGFTQTPGRQRLAQVMPFGVPAWRSQPLSLRPKPVTDVRHVLASRTLAAWRHLAFHSLEELVHEFVELSGFGGRNGSSPERQWRRWEQGQQPKSASSLIQHAFGLPTWLFESPMQPADLTRLCTSSRRALVQVSNGESCGPHMIWLPNMLLDLIDMARSLVPYRDGYLPADRVKSNPTPRPYPRLRAYDGAVWTPPWVMLVTGYYLEWARTSWRTVGSVLASSDDPALRPEFPGDEWNADNSQNPIDFTLGWQTGRWNISPRTPPYEVLFRFAVLLCAGLSTQARWLVSTDPTDREASELILTDLANETEMLRRVEESMAMLGIPGLSTTLGPVLSSLRSP